MWYKSFKHRIGLKPIDRWYRLTAEKIKAWNKDCYNEYKRPDGSCPGLAGGDRSTDYLFNKAADIISSLPGLHVEPDERISTIAHHYGFENQREQLVEECAELIQAAQKCKRNQEGAFDNFIGELADVAIMASQMILLVGGQAVSEAIEQKLERQMRRIRDEES